MVNSTNKNESIDLSVLGEKGIRAALRLLKSYIDNEPKIEFSGEELQELEMETQNHLSNNPPSVPWQEVHERIRRKISE